MLAGPIPWLRERKDALILDGLHASSMNLMGRFLHVSTVDVYPPNVPTIQCTEDVELTTDRHAWYSVTKTLAEQSVLDLHKKGTPVTILRYARSFIY